MSIETTLRKIEDAPGTLVGKIAKIIPTVLKHGGVGILEAIDIRYGFGGITDYAPLDVILGTAAIASGVRVYEERKSPEGKPVSGALKTGVYTALVNTATCIATAYILRLLDPRA